MPFKLGDPKPPNSGRKKGQVCTLAASVRQKLEELGCDPIEGMAQIAMDESNTPELRHKAYADIAQYAYPKLKAVDHTFGGSDTLKHHDNGVELLLGRVNSIAAKLGTGSGDTKPDE